MTTRIYRALSWATTEMPTGNAQAALSRTYQQLQAGGASDDEIVRAMVGAVWDGLAYGNWPGLTDEECMALAQIKAAKQAAR